MSTYSSTLSSTRSVYTRQKIKGAIKITFLTAKNKNFVRNIQSEMHRNKKVQLILANKLVGSTMVLYFPEH